MFWSTKDMQITITIDIKESQKYIKDKINGFCVIHVFKYPTLISIGAQYYSFIHSFIHSSIHPSI
jgi:hypothetical protein